MVRFRIALLALAALAAPVATLDAQTVPPPGTSPQQIQQQIDAMGLRGELLERIRSSGMSEAEIRRELARRGYDPSVLDPYMDPAN